MAVRVAIIGAGVSGATCAWALGRAGVGCQVFEMGRGGGGRMATRRPRDNPALAFNHGAPVFALSSPAVRPVLQALLEAKAVTAWAGRQGGIQAETGQVSAKSTTEEDCLYVGTPGMSSVCDTLAAGVVQHFETMVTGLEWQAEQRTWMLTKKDGAQVGPFDWLVVTSHSLAHPRFARVFGRPPPLQAAADQAASSSLKEMVQALSRVETSPLMVIMVAFEAAPDWEALPLDLAEVTGSPVISKFVRQASSAPFVSFVVHSTPEFAQEYIAVASQSGTAARMGAATNAVASETAARKLLQAFLAVVRPWVPQASPPVWGPTLHRWGSCFPLPTAHRIPAVAHDVRVICCGDHLGPNPGSVEAAAISGLEAASTILGDLTPGKL